MIIIKIPVRRVELRHPTGERRSALKVERSFWKAERVAGDPGAEVNGGDFFISSLFEAAFRSTFTDIQDGEDVCIELFEPSFSNPGVDDEGASLTENLQNVT